MNIHHLELFYYVAKHGGISEAVRNIPYGIQQPAVSYQVLQLEECLDATLFKRRPFILTPAGEKLYRFIEPFFGKLDAAEEEIRGGAAHQLRFGASEIVMRDHLPAIIQRVKQKFPKLKLTLHEGYQPQLLDWLQKQEIDLALTLLEPKPPGAFNAAPLLKLAPVLLVQKGCRLTSAEELWKRDRISEPLICLPPSEMICRNFQQRLAQMGVDWFPSIEVSSIALVETYVTEGYGIGLAVALPKTQWGGTVRALPLEGFNPVVFGAVWQDKVSPLIGAVVAEFQQRARSLCS